MTDTAPGKRRRELAYYSCSICCRRRRRRRRGLPRPPPKPPPRRRRTSSSASRSNPFTEFLASFWGGCKAEIFCRKTSPRPFPECVRPSIHPSIHPLVASLGCPSPLPSSPPLSLSHCLTWASVDSAVGNCPSPLSLPPTSLLFFFPPGLIHTSFPPSCTHHHFFPHSFRYMVSPTKGGRPATDSDKLPR